MRISILFFFIALFFLPGPAHGQKEGQRNIEFTKENFRDSVDNWRRKLRHAQNWIEEGNEIMRQNPAFWGKALKKFNKAYEFNPNSASLNYKIGQCYMMSNSKFIALRYFQKAYQLNPTVHKRIHYMLGRGYHLKGNWKKAEYEYDLYRKNLDQKEDVKEILQVNKRLDEVRNGMELAKDPTRVWIDNLGDSINSQYPEYGAVINADETLLMFTSRRPNTTGGEKDPYLNQYYEDIYYSNKRGDGKWSEAHNFGEEINTDDHDAIISVSPDGRKMFIYRNDNGDGNIYQAIKEDGEWQEPEELHKHVCSDYYENSADISLDGNKLYFTSTRPEGNIGKDTDPMFLDKSNPGPASKDIWVSEWNKDRERWKEPKNLGPTINTKYDEDGVYLHPDGKTMYFASQGHNTMGGYDIFKTVKTDTGWSKPENIGYPVNTPDDDAFFVVGASGRYAYITSFREEGFGEKDLYKLTFLGPEKQPILLTEDNLIASITQPVKEKVIEPKVKVRKSNLAILKGVIRNAKTMKPLKADIKLMDNEDAELISETESDKKSGKFLLSLPAGKNYAIHVSKEDYLFHSENFKIPDSAAYQEITKNIDLKKIEVGKSIVLKNIFFDYDKATLRKESKAELEKLIQMLQKLDDIKIEIGGHTDSRGSDAYNERLSQKRAESVVNYLVEHGISRDRLKAKGYGEKEPIATNDTEDGRQKNRRTEFKVIEK